MNEVFHLGSGLRSVSNGKWNFKKNRQDSPVHLIKQYNKRILKPLSSVLKKLETTRDEVQIVTAIKTSILKSPSITNTPDIKKSNNNYLPSITDKSNCYLSNDFSKDISESSIPGKKVRFNFSHKLEATNSHARSRNESPLPLFCHSVEWSKIANTMKTKTIIKYSSPRNIREKKRKLSIFDILPNQ